MGAPMTTIKTVGAGVGRHGPEMASDPEQVAGRRAFVTGGLGG
jgi:hypothetical protein